MPQVINTNISSLNAQRNLNASQSALSTSLQRLSSGLRINSAKDDAAGLAISDRMTSQIRGLNQATRNANDGVSLAQTAESGLTEVANNLQRIRELAVQSANATNTSTDRASLNAEVNQLLAEIQRVATTSQFNGQNILDGSFTAAQFQVGANANQTIMASTGNAQTDALGSYQAASTKVTGNALAGGDLSINGFAVGASASGSAEDIAAAINAIKNETGVLASATTSVTGSNAIHAFVGIQAGDLLINGTSIGAISGQSTATSQGAAIAAAINAKTNVTGVTAVSNATTGQLTLSSSTGKTISITSGSAIGASRVEAATGLEVTSATAARNTATFTGTAGVTTLTAANVAAVSTDAFVIQGVTFSFGAAAGRVDATHYNVAVGTNTAATDGTALRTAMQLAVTNGDLKNVTVTGAGAATIITSNIGTSTTTHTNVTGSGVAGLASSTLNVGAAGPTVGQTISVGGQTFEFLANINDSVTTAGNVKVALGATGTITATNFVSALATENAAKRNFVTATRGTNDVTLTSNKLGTEGLAEVKNGSATNGAADGDVTGIDFGVATATDGTAWGTDDDTGSTQNISRGTVMLNSPGAFSLTGTVGLTAAGLSGGNVTLSGINTVDISTVAGANSAISLIDGALSQVATIRGTMGALQNRFSSVVSSLTASSENLSAARSRIQDADFASETAQLTRNQILQQAGIAMLAQANSLPQSVLSLLK